jgi:hypothetical protein
MKQADIKVIGSSGQISIGKQHAGRTVIVDEVEEGVWVIKASKVVPESELWLHEPAAAKKVKAGLEWAASHPPVESNLAAFGRKLKRKR